MTMMGTTSIFRPDGGGGGGDDDRGRRSHRYNLRTSRMRASGRASKGSSDVKCGSVAAKRGASGKFLLVGAVLAIQFVGAAAISSKASSDIKVEFTMPEEAEVGSTIDLRCEWRILGGSNLYSVKWYKDDHEFFRYLPDSHQRTQIFPRPGVKVETQANEQKWIKLKDIVLESSGQYKCEVSTEAPSFATTYQTANLTVISPPEKGPEIMGLSTHYSVGDNVTANCTAWPSVPKANLRWTINGKPVSLENTIQYPLPPMSTGSIPNSLGLRLQLDSQHFDKGDRIKIKCFAEVGSRLYEDERKPMKAIVNNQKLRAGNLDAAARSIRAGLLAPLLTTILALILLTT